MGSPASVSAVIPNLYMEDFEEEQALSSVPTAPKIWKRYVDDTFTILKRNHVEDFLQHLNTQQPTIRFTIETENDNTFPFLDTLVIKDSEGRLIRSVYRKPTHTHQYLSCDSHHPQLVIKRGVVKCLYDRSKNIITKPSAGLPNKHLTSVLVFNG